METETITVNIEKEVISELRKLASKGKQKKGFLGKSISTATKKWLEEKRQEEIAKEMIDLMEKGFDMGKIKIKHRSELYDRKY